MTFRLLSPRSVARSVAMLATALFVVGAQAGGPAFTPAEHAVAAPAGLTPSPIVVSPSLPRLPERDLAMAREGLYQHLKALGIPADDIASALVRIDGDAQQGTVVDSTLAQLAAGAADAEASQKALDMLTAYAEMAAFGAPLTVDFDVQTLERINAVQPAKLVPGIPDVIGVIQEPVEPKLGGVCKTCPNFDFGPFTPTTTYQFHSSTLSSGFGDCNWYEFNVTLGNRYEFSTCAPGASIFDTVLELYDPATSCSTFIALNDDCPTSAVASTILWDATFTGVVHLKLRGFSSTEGGAYTLAYRNLGIVCETCGNPNPVMLTTPSASCQCVPGVTTSTCPSNYYTVNLVAGETYTFTTCPAECAGAIASYDTRLRLWSPSCGLVASNDDACVTSGQTTRSTLGYTAAVTGPHRIEVTGRFLSTGTTLFGSYTMCWRRTSAACATCAVGPYRGTFTPTPTCQQHASSVTSCQDSWYQFNLAGGKDYEFTTCSISGGCPLGIASFDSVIELHNSACTPVASDDDGCGGGRSKLIYSVPTGAGGVYKLLVRGNGGATGNYTLTFRELAQACTPPTTVSIAPGAGTTGTSNCSRTETFSLSVDGAATLPITYQWSIGTPAGGNAAPPSGTVTSAAAGGAASFTTTLTHEGAYSITVVASNSCGTITRTVAYALTDIIRPSVTPPASVTVECTAVPPPGTPVVRDNCDPSPAVTFAETITPGACPGNYTIRRTWTATDRSGNVSNPAVQVIAVRDRTPPTITPDLALKYCVYPPNHDVACFDQSMFSPVVADACSPPVTWSFFRVTSSEAGLEPCGDGNQEPDIFVAPDGQSFCVRADRCGNDPAANDGRRYLVEAVATDACGNTSLPMPIGFVLVPHDASDTRGCIEPSPIPLP